MSYYPAKQFVNNEIPTLFNLNTFKTDALQSDNIITNILNVTTQASLPTLSNLGSSPDITDNSNRIATTSYTQSYVNPKLKFYNCKFWHFNIKYNNIFRINNGIKWLNFKCWDFFSPCKCSCFSCCKWLIFKIN